MWSILVSLVDGYNLPMSITNNVGCGVADCPVDLGPDCMCNPRTHWFNLSYFWFAFSKGPAALIGPYDSSGFPVGCKSACEADLDGDPSTSPSSPRHAFVAAHILSSLYHSQLCQLLHRTVRHQGDVPLVWCAVLLLLQYVLYYFQQTS